MSIKQTAIPRLAMLGQDDCEAIHHASLEILRRTGVRVYHAAALELLGRSEALITDENLVRFPPALVEWAVKQAPSEVTLCRRGTREPSLHLSGDRVYYGPGLDCPNYLGLPLIHSPAPMMGGTAPVTVAGGLALGNAEVLSSLIIQQLKRPGAPFICGVQAHHMDMRSTTSVYGSPEYELVRVASAEMARFYGLPIWGNAGMSDSLALDKQAAADVVFSIMVAQLTGTHLAHDVGYLEAGLMTSPEKIVFCAETISQVRQFAQGIKLDAEQIALDVIHAVGPGGSYIAEEHTLRHFKEAWQPGLFRRYRLADWVRQGSKGLDVRLRERTLARIEHHKPKPLPEQVMEEIQRVLGTEAPKRVFEQARASA